MSKKRRLIRAIKKFSRKFLRKSSSTVKKQSLWLLRNFIGTKKRPNSVNSGFVLPTVAMVSLVVVLLTIAIMFRSFERSKNASNVRVNQAVLNAATPAIDRAKAKIDRLFNDPRLPRSTPNDFSLKQIISDKVEEFTFGDETQLTLFYDIDKDGSRNEEDTRSLTEEENLKTAWKYPVDTDNNGKFDSYTLYSIQLRNPPQTGVDPDRVRNPLEARTPPMNETKGSSVCDRAENTSAQLIGTQGWYKRGSVLRRSLFVYTTTVPITNLQGLDNKYETFRGNKGFAALEYQQDRERRPLTNNAVVYNDDLQIAPGGGINLNGRILTNSNLFVARRFSKKIRFFLVSSPASCYFNEGNSKIVVGGNVVNARVKDATDQKDIDVHLFSQIDPEDYPTTEKISSTNKSINLVGGTQIAYNSRAYEKRIDLLVDAAAGIAKTSLPTEIQEELTKAVEVGKDEATEKRALLRSYFRKRTRRVPYAEVSLENTDDDNVVFKKLTGGKYTLTDVLKDSGESMRPPKEWVFPFADDGITHGGYANLELKTNGRKFYLPAQKTDFPEPEGEEVKLGDRVLVGNNLPQMWWDDTKNRFVSQEEAGQEIQNKQWDVGSGTRKRYPQIAQLDDLGDTGRDQFWEENAALYPADSLDAVGGLRVVTSAGIYLPNDYVSNTSFTDTHKTVWPDNMAMGVTNSISSTGTDSTIKGLPHDQTPYLQMRATAVYHFQSSHYDPESISTNPQTPIACVSSFYDPTNEDSAKNSSTYKTKTIPWNTDSNGKSNNGIVYAAPTKGKSDYNNTLDYLASLKYPNGRLVHKQLKKALAKSSTEKLTLAEQSALDSAICGLQIRDGSLNVQSSPVIPHGAIRETTFLDARQVKAVDKLEKPNASNPNRRESATKYELDVELRQPLEIRATVLDLEQLKNTEIGDTTHGTTEYLLPNSGIIYATRDDALPDLSDDADPNDDDDKIGTSSTDFKLDPTRRPNGIMLINGEELNRSTTNQNIPEEKGLILASNLPVYIKGDFNKHTHEEFTNTLSINLSNSNDSWSNFYDRKATQLNTDFACRTGQFTGCTQGEKWRAATVIADAITVLSANFEQGFRDQGDYNLRDNWGYAPFGYDFNGDDNIDDTTGTPVTLDESILKIDLDGDNQTNTTNVTRLNEVILGVDLNNNDNKTDTSVTITERNIPNVVARRLNGFWDNDFVTSYDWWERDEGFPVDSNGDIKSSYFTNFVTPIQRRDSFSEYVMEICRKPTVAACKPEDWVVGHDDDDNDSIDWTDPDEANIKAVIDSGTYEITPNDNSFTVDRLGAGTTARPALNEADQGYPRRVAFLRDSTGNLVLDSDGNPTALGVSGSNNPTPGSTTDDNGEVGYYLISNAGGTYSAPRLHRRALWFKTREGTGTDLDNNSNYGYNYPLWVENFGSLTSSNKQDQPLLIPVLQINLPLESSWSDKGQDIFSDVDLKDVKNFNNGWVQIADNTETNLVFVQGDTPARPNESNGGLENFVRYLEKWSGKAHKATGSFIQYKRSSYATAPWYPIVADYSSSGNNKRRGFSTNGTIFGYPQAYRISLNQESGTTYGRTPFYVQASRLWGFDVALLTQLPDLFSQRFTAPPNGDPNEFYREVSRDDSWVSTLLCAAESEAKPAEYDTAPSTKYGADKEYAIPQNQRPDQCR